MKFNEDKYRKHHKWNKTKIDLSIFVIALCFCNCREKRRIVCDMRYISSFVTSSSEQNKVYEWKNRIKNQLKKRKTDKKLFRTFENHIH